MVLNDNSLNVNQINLICGTEKLIVSGCLSTIKWKTSYKMHNQKEKEHMHHFIQKVKTVHKMFQYQAFLWFLPIFVFFTTLIEKLY